MPRAMRVLLVAALALSCAVEARGQDERRPLAWSLKRDPAKKPIVFKDRWTKDRAMVFPTAEETSLKLGKKDIGVVSDDGRLCAIYDYTTGRVRILGVKGKVNRELNIGKAFMRVHLSNTGMIIAHGKYHHDVPRPTEPLTMFGSKGKTLLRLFNLRSGHSFVRFSPDGTTAAIYVTKDVPYLYVINGQGKKAEIKGKGGAVSNGLMFARKGLKIAAVSYYLGDIDAGRLDQSYITVFDADRTDWRDMRCRGALLGRDQLGLSDDGEGLAVCAPQFVAFYNTKTAKRTWRKYVGHPGTGTIPVGAGAYISVVGKRVIAAHQVPTGKSFRYLISVFDVKGKPQHLFEMPIKGRTLHVNSFLTPEQPYPLKVARMWDVGEDGHSVKLNILPRKRVDLGADAAERKKPGK